MDKKLEERLASSLNELFSGQQFPHSFYLGRSIARGFEEYLADLGFDFTGFVSARGIFKSGFLLNFADDGFYPGSFSQAAPCSYEDIRDLKKAARRSYTFEPGTEAIPMLRELSERGRDVGYHTMRQALKEEFDFVEPFSIERFSFDDVCKVTEIYQKLSHIVCEIVERKNMELLKYARKRN